MNFFWIILIGMTTGWFARQFMAGKGFGGTADIFIGMIGALLGGIVFQETGVMSGSGLIGSMIVATTGAIILLYGARMIKRF